MTYAETKCRNFKLSNLTKIKMKNLVLNQLFTSFYDGCQVGLLTCK